MSANLSNSEFGGRAIRLAVLMTHYRQPLNWTETRLAEAATMLRRFLAAATPCADPPPVEFIEALNDDLNTPRAIAHMHQLRRAHRGRDLWACLRFMGLTPGAQPQEADEWKTFPPDAAEPGSEAAT